MDFSVVFKVLNYVVMVFGIILILIAVVSVAGIGALTADAGEINQGGATFFAALILLPAILQGVIGILAGRAGLQSDPDRCRKLSKILAGLAVLSAFSALRSGTFGFMNILNIAIYGFHCYLAHTQSY